MVVMGECAVVLEAQHSQAKTILYAVLLRAEITVGAP